MTQIEIIGAKPYYEPDTRALCHAVKDGEMGAIQKAAAILAPHVPAYTLLVPVPGHEGRAGYTKILAKAIQMECLMQRKVVLVADILECTPHQSFNELKHKGVVPHPKDIEVRQRNFLVSEMFRKACETRYTPMLVDNVIDTGVTFAACHNATGIKKILCIGDTGNHNLI